MNGTDMCGVVTDWSSNGRIELVVTDQPKSYS